MTELIYSVQEIFDAVGRRGCLQQHGCGAYRIPPYQRGYKWGSETKQPVDQLLADLRDAWEKGSPEYLLQAITVKKVLDGDHGPVLEVIDGQQRLTTLFILLHALAPRSSEVQTAELVGGRLRYSIRHTGAPFDETVAGFLDPLPQDAEDYEGLVGEQKVEEETRQDRYYLRCAAIRIVTELNQLRQAKVQSFATFVLKRVKIMVNAVEPHISGEEIFGNLNSNRVPLTEVELIKGLLLTRVARETNPSDRSNYREVLERRIHLGRLWGEMGQWAARPDIQPLYFPASQICAIMGLLELVGRQMTPPFAPPANDQKIERPLFEHFLSAPKPRAVFDLLRATYERLRDWHENREDYHLLGFCLVSRKPHERTALLVKQLQTSRKRECRGNLFGIRQKMIWLGGGKESRISTGAGDPEPLYYGDDDDKIRSIFLALSVFDASHTARFDFTAYQNEDWSLEHIFPQSPFGKGAKLSPEQKEAALAMFIANKDGILSENAARELADLKAKGAGEEEIVRAIQEDQSSALHSFGNLCLLSRRDNSAMGCGMFNDKRQVIRNRIAEGSFVPRHTYEVFSKMIVGEAGSLDCWSREDVLAHEAEIVKRVKRLWEENA